MRTALGVLAGIAAWWFLFFGLGVGIGLLWPEYRDAARLMMQERSFLLFTLPMLIVNLVVFAAAGLAAGQIATVVARTRKSALAVSLLLFLYAGTQHYVLLWNQLPDWYNLVVPIVIAGSVWLGGRVARFGP